MRFSHTVISDQAPSWSYEKDSNPCAFDPTSCMPQCTNELQHDSWWGGYFDPITQYLSMRIFILILWWSYSSHFIYSHCIPVEENLFYYFIISAGNRYFIFYTFTLLFLFFSLPHINFYSNIFVSYVSVICTSGIFVDRQVRNLRNLRNSR